MTAHQKADAQTKETLKIAVVQMTSSDRFSQNSQIIEKAIESACSDLTHYPDVIFFPENSLMFRVDKNHSDFHIHLESDAYIQFLAHLSEQCARKRVSVHLGSFPAVNSRGEKYNYSVWVNEFGKVQPIYNKIHLFDVDVPGAPPVRESDSFTQGSHLTVGVTNGWKFGFSICYDIRFSELYSEYALRGVDVILIPAAFLVPTGEAHWTVLNRARAIESQCYVVSAAQAGTHNSERGPATRHTYGHSHVISPWGAVLVEAGGGSNSKDFEISFAELAKEAIRVVRERIPMKQHRKVTGGQFPISEVNLDGQAPN